MPDPPRPLGGELVRKRLLETMRLRFVAAVTVVVAAAGFGKSTLLGQAVRSNHAEPRGYDAWVSCQAGDGDARVLADAVVSALGHDIERRDPLDWVLEAFGRHAPIDVCLLIDDVHEVPVGSPGAELLARIVNELPPHAHVVLAGRQQPPVPLARRRAAEQVVDIGGDDLAFTPLETSALATSLDRPDQATELGKLAGWPALVRLALSAPAGSASQYVWEEVVTALCSNERGQLAALATLGWGTPVDVAAVASCERVDLDALATKVPLVARRDDGSYAVHEFWEDVVEHIFPSDQLADARMRALDLFRYRGETLRTGWSALRWGDDAALGWAARRLVRDTFGALPIDTATRWLEARGNTNPSSDLRLLKIALAHARNHDARCLDDEIDEVADEYLAAGDQLGVGGALALGAVIAHERGDHVRLVAIDQRARCSIEGSDEPTLRFLAGALPVGLASLLGEIDVALTALSALTYDDVPAVMTELVTRLHVTMLCLSGQAHAALAIAAPLAGAEAQYMRTIPAHVRWLDGDPAGFAGAPLSLDPGTETNDRYRFLHAAHVTLVAASLGDLVAIEEFRTVIEKRAAGSIEDSRDRAIVAAATAARRVAEHDEAGAKRVIADHLDSHPPEDRLADVHLRRAPALAYVLDARARERWKAAALGPSLARQCAIAELLLAARDGALDPRDRLPPAAVVLTALPLPWSVELAARAVATGSYYATGFAEALASFAPHAMRRELEHVVSTARSSNDTLFGDAAQSLLDAMADPTRPPVSVDVLGPFRVRVGHDNVDSPNLRRRRVRALVELLALIGPVRRERLTDLMWPDLDAAAGSRNLRVTLTRVRRLLEPDRPAGARCSTLCFEHDMVALAHAPAVEVDLWEFRRELAAADAAERRGDPVTVVAMLERACNRWRGDPLADVELDDVMAGAVEEVRQLVVDTAARLGELLLVAGRFDDAVTWAQRVVGASPYSERGHRLAIAAHLHKRDHDGADRVVATVGAMLDDLGVDPEPSTQMLIRQAASRARLYEDEHNRFATAR